MDFLKASEHASVQESLDFITDWLLEKGVLSTVTGTSECDVAVQYAYHNDGDGDGDYPYLIITIYTNDELIADDEELEEFEDNVAIRLQGFAESWPKEVKEALEVIEGVITIVEPYAY